MKDKKDIPVDKPVLMYIHGFMSGANGAKQKQLQKQGCGHETSV